MIILRVLGTIFFSLYSVMKALMTIREAVGRVW